jgi:hypothetical protein
VPIINAAPATASAAATRTGTGSIEANGLIPAWRIGFSILVSTTIQTMSNDSIGQID